MLNTNFVSLSNVDNNSKISFYTFLKKNLYNQTAHRKQCEIFIQFLYLNLENGVYVQQFLGHKTINHTLKYIQLAEALFQDVGNFIVKTAKTPEEAKALLEAGFQKADEFDGIHLYRKHK